MGKCVQCGINFVGTAERPPTNQLCMYCKIDLLKTEYGKVIDQRDAYKAVIDAALDQLDSIFPEENKISLSEGIERFRKKACVPAATK